jgi:hypothetical protein
VSTEPPTLERLIVLVDGLRTQLADVRNQTDEIGRDIRHTRHHADTVVKDCDWQDHNRKSISSAVCAAFDALEQIDKLIAALTAPPPPPPGGTP